MKNRKKIHLLLPMMCLIVFLSGCQGSKDDADGTKTGESETPQATETPTGTEDFGTESLLDEATIICEKLSVNLVESESNNRIIVQQNVQEMEIWLTVSLADGTTGTIKYPMDTEKDFACLETAYLQYDNKESIVLEIVNGTSNYGAAQYHVLHVEKEDDGIGIVEDATVLDGQDLTETGDRYSGSLLEFSDYTNTSFTTEENLITTRNQKPAVCVTVWDSNTREDGAYYLYYDLEWKLEGEGSSTAAASQISVSVASFWDREGAVLLSAEDAAVIVDLVESGGWTEGTSDCLNDCILFMDSEEIQYSSDCGTFNDTGNEKSLHLTEEQQAEVNAILEKYIALEQILEDAPVTEEKPVQSAGSSSTPQNGTIQDGKIYIEGFGWVDYEGGGTEGIYAEDMYENGNTIGTMD